MLALVAFLGWRSGARTAADRPPGAAGGAPDARPEAGEMRATEPAAPRTPVAERGTAAAVPAPPEDLRAALRRLGELYVEFARGTSVGRLEPELEGELRAVLEPLVNQPEVVQQVLGLLQSGALVRRGDDSERGALTLEETGAMWSQSWAFASYNAAGELLRPEVSVDGGGFALGLFGALPWIRERTAVLLAKHLLSATDAEGAPILDRRFLADLLVIARANPDVLALRALLMGLAERLDDVERIEILRFYLPADDPDRVIAELKSYLGGPAEFHGIQMAGMLFEREPDAQLRSRIAVAVISGAADPFAAAGFLARHGAALRNDMVATFAMARRPDGLPALDAEYAYLLGADADARARTTLVYAMEQAPPARLIELARNEPDDVVSSTALYRATVGRDGDPSAEALALLGELGARRSVSTTLALIESADSLARGFRRAGRARESLEATRFLESVAREESTTPYYREQALKALRGLMAEAEYEALLGAVPGDE
jgi:hypothetical protein